MRTWNTPEDFENFLAAGGTGFIFKHSTRCGISSEAYKQVEAFTGADPEVPTYLVPVVESRATSSAIAEKLNVPHASPQAILLHEGRVIWHSSHWDITKNNLQNAWEAIEAT